MKRKWRLLVASVVVVGAMTAGQQPAMAGCHSFTIEADPGSVGEGGTVTVTVTRDAAVNPSRVDVSNVDETARASQDYPAVKRTISFTTETQQTFTVAVTDDSVSEPAETFRLHLSNPGGCAINPNFELGSDARVTIPANDTGGATPSTPAPAPTAPPTTRVGAGTTAPSETTTEPTSTTATPDAGATTTTEPTTEQAAGATDEDEDGGGPGAAVAVAVIAAILVLGGGGYLLYRRRSTPTR